MQKQTGFGSRIGGLEEAQRFGESSRQGRSVPVDVPTESFIPNFEEEFLTRGERGVGREQLQVPVNFNEAWEEAELSNIRFPQRQEEFNQAWNQKVVPLTIWEEERNQFIQMRMNDPIYIKFTDTLIRTYSEEYLLNKFYESTTTEEFAQKIVQRLGGFSLRELDSYLSVLALVNTRNEEEFVEANNTKSPYYFLKGLVSKYGKNLKPILQEQTEAFDWKLSAYVNERGEQYLLEFASSAHLSEDRPILHQILETPELRYILSVEMEKWDYKKIKNLLLGNYNRKQLRTLAEGYRIIYNDTTPRETIIERLLDNKQASKDLIEMLNLPPEKWIVKRMYSPKGILLNDTRRDGTVIHFHENGNISDIGKRINGPKDGEFRYYYKNGSLRQIINYKNGLEEGPFENIDTLKRRTIGQYHNGEEVGIWYTYSSTGNLVRTVNWDDEQKMLDFFERNYSHDQLKRLAKSYQIRFGVFDDPPDEYLVKELFKTENAREDILEMMKGDPRDWIVEQKMLDFFERNYSHDQLKRLAKGYQIRFGVFDDPPDEYLVEQLFKTENAREDILEMMKGDPRDWIVEKTFWGNGGVKSIITRENRIENYYSDGALKETGLLIDGKKENVWMYFRPDGSLEQSITYKDDILNGKNEKFWPNEKPKQMGMYKDGSPVGTWQDFDKNGNLIKETIYTKENEQFSVRDSRKLWDLYSKSLRDPSKIPELLQEIPEKDTTIYAPEDFDIFEVEEALAKGQKNSYLPSRNPKSFEPIIKKLRGVYYRPFPLKSVL